MTADPRSASEIVATLSIEERSSLTSGGSFWTTESVARLPSLLLADGPHGLRKQTGGVDHIGLSGSEPATCFPPAATLGCSWDPDLVRRVGSALGVEAAIAGVAVLLGPGINIKRSPLCGRNFEYFSEDPVIGGALGAAMVEGVQSRGVGASVKHFAANNQEFDRMRSSSDIDPRPLREIYLRGFQRVVQDAAPWTVMASYNRLNGVYTTESHWLLTELLRDEWGFDGLVVSDWAAVIDRVSALEAGLDLEMPTSGGRTDAEVVAAIRTGRLSESVLDEAARRVVELIRRADGRERIDGPVPVDEHHELAREAAARSLVLLKNDDDLLPLHRSAGIAVIGAFAAEPRFQGAGSSSVNPTRVDSALDALRGAGLREVAYAPGFTFAADDEALEVQLRHEAVAVAAVSDVAVVFLGLPATEESEGFDRRTIDLPRAQLALLDAITAANPRTVVVLSHGGVVAIPFRNSVPAILDAWLPGQAGGRAIADVLLGDCEPSGRLTETVPLRIQDSPAYLDFPGEHGHVRYGEGLFVGYRWYDARDLPVAFPFGHGLSYTRFEYSDPSALVTADGSIDVSVTVRNTGPRDGREVVQVYSSLPNGRVQRPPRELRAFRSVLIPRGESRIVKLVVHRDDLAYWDIRVGRWAVEDGEYVFDVGSSSRDLRVRASVAVEGDDLVLPLTKRSPLGELLDHPVAGPATRPLIERMLDARREPGATDEQQAARLRSMRNFPADMVAALGDPGFTHEVVARLVALAPELTDPRTDRTEHHASHIVE